MIKRDKSSSEAGWFAVGGAVLLGLAAVFLWLDLAIRPEYVLVPAAALLTALGLVEQPRTRPDLGMIGLLVCAVIGAGSFAGGAYLGVASAQTFQPLPLLFGIGLALSGAICIAATTWRRAVARGDDARAARLIYSLVAIALLVSPVLYYQLLTVGIAEDNVARRLVLTLAWLVSGVALVLFGRGRRELRNGGSALVLAAVAKALIYDTTHLDGPLRIAVLGVSGLLLLGCAWALRAVPEVKEAREVKDVAEIGDRSADGAPADGRGEPA